MATQAKTTTAAKPVTVENFTRAETDMYLTSFVEKGGFGKFYHIREMTPIDDQMVIRGNRDTLYSNGVFDLDGGPVTFTLPNTGGRFMSMLILDEDQYGLPVVYEGSKTVTREDIGTRYFTVLLRTFVNPDDPNDIAAAHQLQDAVKVEQASAGNFEVPVWDKESQDKVRAALLVLAETLPDAKKAFGSREEVDPVRFLIACAAGWGGNPEKEATYLNRLPAKNDGKTVHKLTIKGEVPVDGFWSVTVYDRKGFMPKNDLNVYSYNRVTAEPEADGSIIIQFGGSPKDSVNCLPIVEGWNYCVRLYRPQKEILDGTWKFPEARPLN